jgi:hypothetical protein
VIDVKIFFGCNQNYGLLDMEENDFQQYVRRIEDAYAASGNTIGWRFLNCSREVLRSDPQIALLSTNPAGNYADPYHPPASCENGHSYLIERWADSFSGASPLQKQFQGLFLALSEHVGYHGRSS